MQGSSINKMLTLDYMQHEPENKYFYRKSVKIRPTDVLTISRERSKVLIRLGMKI